MSEYAAVVLTSHPVACLEGGTATIYGDGGQARDFTYIDDVVAANLLAARRWSGRAVRPQDRRW